MESATGPIRCFASARARAEIVSRSFLLPPILVINLRAVLGRDCRHVALSLSLFGPSELECGGIVRDS